MMNDLELKDSKSNVFSNFEGNAVSGIDSLSKLACFILLSAVGLSNFISTNIRLATLQEILSGEMLLLLFMELVIGPLLPFNKLTHY